MTGQYYLRARYYNPVIARFTQEDTYYGDGLNLYTYCQNNPILYHDPTGHGTKENSPYSRKEQQYIDAGADPDTARLAAQCYPDAKSKQDLYNKYKKQGYSAQDAKKLANREIIHGEEATKKYIKDNNVKKSGPDYTATSPRDNVNTDWRTQERLNAQRNAGAGKGNESGNKSSSSSEGCNIPGRGYHKEVYANKPVKVTEAVDKWEDFLGPGEYTDIHPRTGLKDPDRIFSADGKRSIRFGSHEMNSKPSKFHYHEEVWTYDPINNVMNVDNTVVRMPYKN